MYNLSISNFICYEDENLKFKKGINLISGVSGAGKSSIFRAIYWCLYGTFKDISINKDLRTIVTFSYDSLSITRYTNPIALTLNVNNVSYQNQGAQEKIIEFYGTHDVWLSTCLIQQKCFNILFNSTSSSKMAIITEIIFKDNNPSIIIDQLDEKIKEHNLSFNYEQRNLTDQKIQYDSFIKIFRKDKIIDENNYHIQELENQLIMTERMEIENKKTQELISMLNNKFSILKNKDFLYLNLDLNFLSQELENSKEKSNIEEQLNSLNKIKPDNFRNFTEEDYNLALSMEYEYNAFISTFGVKPDKDLYYYIDLLTKENKIIKEFEIYNHELEIVHREYLKRKEFDTSRIQEDYNRKLEEFNIKQAEIQHVKELKILEINRDIERRNYLENRINNLIKSIQSYSMNEPIFNSIIEPDILEISYSDLQNEKFKYEGQDVNCPNCNILIKVNNKSVVKYDADKVNYLNQEIEKIINFNNKAIDHNQRMMKLRNEYDNYLVNLSEFQNRQISLQQMNEELSRLQNEYSEFQNKNQRRSSSIRSSLTRISTPRISPVRTLDLKNFTSLIPFDLKSKYNNLTNANMITNIPSLPEFSSKFIKQCMEYQSIVIKYSELCQNLHKFKNVRSMKEILIDIQTYNNVKEENMKIEIHNQYIEKSKSDILIQLDNLKFNEIKENSLTIKERLCYYNSLIEESRYHCKLLEFITYFENYNTKLVEYGDFIMKLKRVKAIAIESECQILEMKINLINQQINEVVKRIFTKSCSLSIKMFKDLKNKNIKPEVNIEGSYDGRKFNKLNQISGGESDRISLALTIGLSSVSNFPILMFDETLNSLDEESKIRVINTLKECTNKTILIIGHDHISGFCDNQICV